MRTCSWVLVPSAGFLIVPMLWLAKALACSHMVEAGGGDISLEA